MGFSKNWCISPLKQCVYGCGYSILIYDTYILGIVLSSAIIFPLFSVLCVLFVSFAFLTFNFEKLYLISTFLINENKISYQWLFFHLHIAHLIDWTKNLFLFSFYSHHHHQNNRTDSSVNTATHRRDHNLIHLSPHYFTNSFWPEQPKVGMETQLVNEFVSKTRASPTDALSCLRTWGWDLKKALIDYNGN